MSINNSALTLDKGIFSELCFTGTEEALLTATASNNVLVSTLTDDILGKTVRATLNYGAALSEQTLFTVSATEMSETVFDQIYVQCALQLVTKINGTQNPDAKVIVTKDYANRTITFTGSEEATLTSIELVSLEIVDLETKLNSKASQEDLAALDAQVVKITGDQTVAGVKTFSSSPVAPTPADEDNSTQLATTAWINSNACMLYGDQTVEGNKTFTSDIQATAYGAYFGDLAEYYKTDSEYPKGTLVQFGGEEEITVATTACNAVITSNPGFVLNNKSADNAQAIALIGRVLVRVIGEVDKFEDISLSYIPGVACRGNNMTVIGKALEAKTTIEEDLVECIVKLAF